MDEPTVSPNEQEYIVKGDAPIMLLKEQTNEIGWTHPLYCIQNRHTHLRFAVFVRGSMHGCMLRARVQIMLHSVMPLNFLHLLHFSLLNYVKKCLLHGPTVF